jgi:hypothetical protein
MENLKIIFIGTNTLIGELENREGDMILKRPRAIATGKNPQGQPVIGFQPLIGLPEEVELISPLLMYDLIDKELINIYIQSVSGIVPAQGLPEGILMGGKGGRG